MGGSAVCSSCRYEYEPEKGDPENQVAAGVAFKDLPQDWDCPVCGVGKNKFTANDKVVAGFAENQTYGLGTNSWTEGQKLPSSTGPLPSSSLSSSRGTSSASAGRPHGRRRREANLLVTLIHGKFQSSNR